MDDKLYTALFQSRAVLIDFLLKQLHTMCVVLDPNWATICFRWQGLPRGKKRRGARFDSFNNHYHIRARYEGTPSFCANPVCVILNGPVHGDVELDVKLVRELIEPVLFVALVELTYKLGTLSTASLTVINPSHELRIIPGITQFMFENCSVGTVLTGTDDDFVVGCYCAEERPSSLRRYSKSRLESELLIDDARCGEAVGYRYLPLRSTDDGELCTLVDRLDVTSEEVRAIVSKLPAGEDVIRLG